MTYMSDPDVPKGQEPQKTRTPLADEVRPGVFVARTSSSVFAPTTPSPNPGDDVPAQATPADTLDEGQP